MSEQVRVEMYLTKAQARRLRQALRSVRQDMSPCGSGTVGGHVLEAAGIDGRGADAFDTAALAMIVALSKALGEGVPGVRVRGRGDYFNPRDVAILGGDPSL